MNIKLELEFVKYEYAVRLVNLGYNQRCMLAFYRDKNFELIVNAKNGYSQLDLSKNNHISAPLYQQVFRWFRKEHGLYSSIVPKKSWPDDFVSGVEWYVSICGGNGKEIGPDGVYSYSEAQEECVKRLIEIVENSIS